MIKVNTTKPIRIAKGNTTKPIDHKRLKRRTTTIHYITKNQRMSLLTCKLLNIPTIELPDK